MNLLRVLTAAAAAAAILAASAHSSTFSARSLSDAHVGTSRAELLAQRSFSETEISRLRHDWRFAPRHANCWAHVPWSKVCDHVRRRVRAQRWLLSMAEGRLARLYPVLPPHEALWMCIHGHEAGDWANRDTGGNGHYGGLQMHPGWGYGTSYYASEDSAMTQMWSAERGYRASGFSTRWLLGQWYHPDCLRYA